MHFAKVLCGFACLLTSISSVAGLARPRGFHLSDKRANDGLQNLVTWDAHSIKIRGERLMIYSGEFHPFRLPVPGLWLDVFQKIKAMGFNGVSFYTYWGLLEGNPGHIYTEGVFALQPFFDAASEAGIYLIARPGPYINAETAAGGLAAWTLRINATLRSFSPEYLNATQLYAQTIGGIIAKAQITNGGPVVLFQPENEYTTWPGVNLTSFPDYMNKQYMAYVEQQFRDAGIVVPFIMNDNQVRGDFAPGTGLGAVDIYGIDAYPMRYDCGHPSVWPTYRFPRNWQILHEEESPTTPFVIAEFQGGTGTGWGSGVGQDMCNALVNEEAVRVVYKNNYGYGVKLFNIYMTYGGTNWGNLGHQGGDSSYDYGAAITEDRHIWREKYSEEKLEANFFKVSPAYLTAIPGNGTNGTHVNTKAIAITPVMGTNAAGTNFYVARHADFTSMNTTTYKLHVPTSIGKLTIPVLGGHLTLFGRDSKIHLTDYNVGGINMIYCTSDLFTWAKADVGGRRVLILYGGAGETHEFALSASVGKATSSKGSVKSVQQESSATIVQWHVTPEPQMVSFSNDLDVYMLWRNDAYNYWTLELQAPGPIGNYSSPSKSFVIVKAGYLLRTASIAESGTVLQLTGDVNATTAIELIFEPTGKITSLTFNGKSLQTTRSSEGTLVANMVFNEPTVNLPNFSMQEWRMIDSLPEIQASYDDSLWTVCNHTTSTNPTKLQTPTSLYADDYGYHAGSLIYRGHFTGNGQETTVFLNTSGGIGYGHSVWLNSTFLGSWTGSSSNVFYGQSFSLPSLLKASQPYVLTVLIDHMGQDEEAPGTDAVKFPRGFLNYSLSAHAQSDVTWKVTGNLGGEQYLDKTRGPRNEGAMFVERQGYILPKSPSDGWAIASPFNGSSEAGVGFYSTSFDLDIPMGYDVPISFVLPNISTAANFRVQLFVNGWQFGKYVSNLGPQTIYPVPEGILNYHGSNYVGITLWALDAQGARLDSFELVTQMPVQSGYARPALSPMSGWQRRPGAY